MDPSTTISIIMPLFNCESFIEEALDSIQSQTILETPVHIEISICDDGSSDRSLDIIRSWKAKSSQVKLLLSRNKANIGPGESRNAAVLQSTGEYLAMLDADDVMVPERLERQLAAWRDAPEPDATIVGCHFRRFPADSTPRYQARLAQAHNTIRADESSLSMNPCVRKTCKSWRAPFARISCHHFQFATKSSRL